MTTRPKNGKPEGGARGLHCRREGEDCNTGQKRRAYVSLFREIQGEGMKDISQTGNSGRNFEKGNGEGYRFAGREIQGSWKVAAEISLKSEV